jgi:drug/metabolite transporter (DMT)-like permease
MIGSLVIPMILAPYLYDGDHVSLLQWIGCILIFVCVFLFSGGKDTEKKSGTLPQKIAAVTACAFGNMLSGVTKKYYTYRISQEGLGTIEYFTFIGFVTVLIIFGILFAVFYANEKQRLSLQAPAGTEVKVPLPYKSAGIFILIAAGALYVNELFTSYASQLPSAIYYPLARGLTIGCTFLLDWIVFKEKLTVRKLIGLVLVILAIVLVNL